MFSLFSIFSFLLVLHDFLFLGLWVTLRVRVCEWACGIGWHGVNIKVKKEKTRRARRVVGWGLSAGERLAGVQSYTFAAFPFPVSQISN